MSEQNDDNGVLVILDRDAPARLAIETSKPVLDFRIRGGCLIFVSNQFAHAWYSDKEHDC